MTRRTLPQTSAPSGRSSRPPPANRGGTPFTRINSRPPRVAQTNGAGWLCVEERSAVPAAAGPPVTPRRGGGGGGGDRLGRAECRAASGAPG